MRRQHSRLHLSALRKRNALLSGIDVWGLFGILLVLLFILMVYVPVPYHGVSVDRATAVHSTPMPGAKREDAMRIFVLRDGRIYFGNHAVATEDLPDEIRERLRNGAERKIYLAVDARAKYADAEKVLDQVRVAGIRDVSLLTEQPYR
jgi:biopolymer transport protein ExbD